jgi:hypothetical protein
MNDLKDILSTMNVPEMRRDISNASNLRWLSRNIFINNPDHPRLYEALRIIERLLIMKGVR